MLTYEDYGCKDKELVGNFQTFRAKNSIEGIIFRILASAERARALRPQNALRRNAQEHSASKMHSAETRKSTRAAKCASPLRARALRWQNALCRSAGEHFGSKMRFLVPRTSTLHAKCPSTFRGRAFCFADCVCLFRGRSFRLQKASRRYDQCKAS